jgi:diacylglycerol kinase family enzyme
VTAPATQQRVRLIVNPAAAAVSTRLRAAVNRALADHDVDEVETEEPNHASELARQAAAEGIEAIAVLGGDGTVNEVANGLLASGARTSLAPLPAGSTNVFARTMGLPRHADDAAARIADALADGSSRTIPVGWANGRAFLFHVGIGFDAAVVEQVERRSSLKRRIGQAIFVYAAFATWFRHYDHSRPRFRVELDDGSTVDDGYFAICLNSNPYTFLGPRPLNVAPGATGERGVTMVTLRKLNVRALLGVTGRALGKGDRVARHRDVDVRKDQAHLVVHGHGPVPWQADGDYMGESEELVLSSEPGRLRVVVPVGRATGPDAEV